MDRDRSLDLADTFSEVSVRGRNSLERPGLFWGNSRTANSAPVGEEQRHRPIPKLRLLVDLATSITGQLRSHTQIALSITRISTAAKPISQYLSPDHCLPLLRICS
jgi:hypothetical protein